LPHPHASLVWNGVDTACATMKAAYIIQEFVAEWGLAPNDFEITAAAAATLEPGCVERPGRPRPMAS